MDKPTADTGILKIKGEDGKPPGPPVLRDVNGNVVPPSGGPRVLLPWDVAREVMAAPPEARAELAKKIMARRSEARKKRQLVEKVTADKKDKRRAKSKAARKQRRR